MVRRKSKDYNDNWVQTVVSIAGLVFAVLVALGVVTPEQVTEGLPILTSVLTAVSSVIAGVIALIGLFFKQSEPTV